MRTPEERDTTVAEPVSSPALSAESLSSRPPSAERPSSAPPSSEPLSSAPSSGGATRADHLPEETLAGAGATLETVSPHVRTTPVPPSPRPASPGPAARPARGRPRPRGGARNLRRVTAVLLAATIMATGGGTTPQRPGWASPGLVGGGGWPFSSVPLAPDEAEGASYLPDSTAVRLADGRVLLVPPGRARPLTVEADDPLVGRAVRTDQAWLARGTVPAGGLDRATGAEAGFRDMAARALLDLRLLTRPNGASLASWYSKWGYTWPRDSAFAVAAFTVTGHPPEARRILGFLARVQNENGMWAARYHPDGTAVSDGRAAQLDSLGWVLWAAWFHRLHHPAADEELPELWPMVRRAADHLARSLDAEGLPPASSDYWERDPRSEQDPRRPTLGVVGPVLAGLRSAADIAERRGDGAKADQWRRAARRVSDAVDRQFAPYGYPRSPVPGGLMDTSVTFIAPPFAAADPGVTAAIRDAARKQALPNGGVLPGERWSGTPDVAWTPEVAMFGLAAAASGRTEDAVGRLSWLASHRTSLGVLPEKVGPAGHPAGPAPLGWTAALVLLSLSALQKPLPIPPAG